MTLCPAYRLLLVFLLSFRPVLFIIIVSFANFTKLLVVLNPNVLNA